MLRLKISLKIIAIATFTSTLSSCFKEDEPVPPYQSPDGVTTVVAEMGPQYAKQLFFDFETMQFVKIVDRTSWDLAFSCAPGEQYVFLNEGNFMKAANTGMEDFESVTSSSGLNWNIDDASGAGENSAIGKWGTQNGMNIVSDGKVYVIDRGYSPTGAGRGFKKIQFHGMSSGVFSVRIANLNGTNDTIIHITKDPNFNYVFLSLDNSGQIVSVEPPKTDWDIVFAQYVSIVSSTDGSIVEPYSVNGVLLNDYQVGACREFSRSFEEIEYTDIPSYSFSDARDIIGYDWKEFSFTSMTYVVLPNRNYLVRDTEGKYFKFRFINFVNDAGQNGYPKMEIARF